MTDTHTSPPRATTKDLRNFGLTFGGVATIFALAFWWKGRLPVAQNLGIAAAVFFVLAAVAPAAFRPFHGPWMKFAEILGYINTRILLGLFFFVGVTPMGLVMRLGGKDPMGRSFKKKGVTSYWAEASKHEEGVRHFERQF